MRWSLTKLRLLTVEYGPSSYRGQTDVADNSVDNFANELAKPSTPEKANSLPGVCDETALLSQLNEACQLSAALQRGLDMCTDINACNKAENRGIETPTRDHPVARQLDDLKHLYRQVCIRFHLILQ